MKFLVITNHSYMLWQFRRELIAALLKKGEVVLSMPFVGHEDDFAAMGCRCVDTAVDRRGIDPRTDLKLYRTYRKLLKDERPDLVLTFSIKPNVYAGFACRMLKIPYFGHVQGLGTAFQRKGLAQLVTVMYRMAFRRAKAVFFENESNAELFRRRKIIPAEKIAVLHGAGINLRDYALQPYPSEEDGLHFLYLGRIMKEKGMDELFAAMRRLKSTAQARVTLDLVGFFEDEYKEEVERLVQEGVAVFHGFQQDPRPFYAAAHCVVLPSYHEGMSNVLLEAAATGRALITSDIPGCREAVDAGVTGLLCPSKDADALYECMAAFTEYSAEARRTMGEAGREKMDACFDKDEVVQNTLQVLGV